MYEELTIFETMFTNEELNQEFNKFFYANNLISLFTNEHRAGTIRVTYLDARSVVNNAGSYHKDLLTFSDIINSAMDNKSYEQAVFKILYSANTFQKFMKTIREIITQFNTTLPQHLFNFWNIVYYNKDLF